MEKTSEIQLTTGTGNCRVLFGKTAEVFANKGLGLPDLVVTDSTVDRLYPGAFAGVRRLVLPPGEFSKSLEVIQKVYQNLIDNDLDRSGLIIGFGGGVICDIVGFVGATYLRGIHWGFVPTTLLAQVDAAIGGKNGINFAGLKNRIGTIAQPEFVIVDSAYLTTLTDDEFACGLAELVKIAAVGDAGLFSDLESASERLIGRYRETLEAVVARAVALKCEVVTQDATETGLRRVLNFGHTFGHAIEQRTGAKHGFCVAMGMVLAARISVKQGLLPIAELTRLENLLHYLGLPIHSPIAVDELVGDFATDKKRAGDTLHFVFLETLGKGRVRQVPFETLKGWADDLR